MERISITKELVEFHEHLENNRRVVLSAKFGEGKTTFLQEFKKVYEGSYKFIEIHPLDYAVAPNSDIFEYLKRDIMLQLAGEKEALDFDLDLDTLGKQIFNWESLFDVVKFLLATLPMGPVASKVIDKCAQIKQKYDEKKNTFPSYLNSFATQRGGIYERDAYTVLIEETIKRIHEREEGEGARQTVLIIEDLDRMDPAHIFRILNVLGAHINDATDGNKFFFSNIIFVMDYEVTEHIFHHFYGDHANYTGYMSKFCSNYPFRFSITKVAHEYLKQFIEQQCGMYRGILDLKIYNRYTNHEYPLSSIIHQLSVRQISNITDGIERQISEEPVALEQGGAITPISPLTKLLAVLVRIGVRFRLSDLLYELKNQKLLPYLLQQHLMLDQLFHGTLSFTYQGGIYSFTELPSDDGQRMARVVTGNGFSIDIDVEKRLETVFYKSIKSVKDLDKVALLND